MRGHYLLIRQILLNQRRRSTNHIIYFYEILQFFGGENTAAYQLHVVEDMYVFQYVINISAPKGSPFDAA